MDSRRPRPGTARRRAPLAERRTRRNSARSSPIDAGRCVRFAPVRERPRSLRVPRWPPCPSGSRDRNRSSDRPERPESPRHSPPTSAFWHDPAGRPPPPPAFRPSNPAKARRPGKALRPSARRWRATSRFPRVGPNPLLASRGQELRPGRARTHAFVGRASHMQSETAVVDPCSVPAKRARDRRIVSSHRGHSNPILALRRERDRRRIVLPAREKAQAIAPVQIAGTFFLPQRDFLAPAHSIRAGRPLRDSCAKE